MTAHTVLQTAYYLWLAASITLIGVTLIRIIKQHFN